MILTRSQVSLIANRVRELPDAVLAEIGFERVIGVAERPVPRADPLSVAAIESTALVRTPPVIITSQTVDGQKQQRLVQVVRRQKRAEEPSEPKRMTPAERVQAVIEFVKRNPGVQARHVMKHLGCDRGVTRIAVHSARDMGAIEIRGNHKAAAYYPKAERSAA